LAVGGAGYLRWHEPGVAEQVGRFHRFGCMCAPVIMTGSCTDRWNLPTPSLSYDLFMVPLVETTCRMFALGSGLLESVLTTHVTTTRRSWASLRSFCP
jgi:hypothetical protein